MLRSANEVLAFLVELAAIAALVTWGFTVGTDLFTRLLLGLGSPALLVAVWAIWLAPASSRRLAMPWLAVVKLVVLGRAAVALAAAGHPWFAALLGSLVLVNVGLAVRGERA